tara:strand:+ start:2936 stop:4165 length:1230 start_codon:yes stop_codon:yes gene_type:complete
LPKPTYIKTFKKGEIICKEGERGKCAYLLEHGRVEVLTQHHDKLTRVAIIGAGEIFGEMAVLNSTVRSATIRALDDCEVVEISKSSLKERIDESDDIVKYLVQVLIGRLRESLKFVDETSPMDDKTTSTLIDIQNFKKTQEVVEKIKLEKSLKSALENDEFAVNYQPIVDLESSEVAGFEALMRWNSPERGVVRPDIFMGLAEETSLIIPMGQWIIKKVCYDYARLKKKMKAAGRYHSKLFVSINVAVKQFNDPKLFEVLDQATQKYGLEPSEIKLEITERVLIAGDYVFEWIKKARSKGYSVALDDFGTGYSSLSYLANLDVNNIKIDKSFVDKMTKDRKTFAIVKSIIQLSHALEMTVIAEGIEDLKEYSVLKKLGCNFMQGYYFSKPLTLTDTIILMTGKEVKKAA